MIDVKRNKMDMVLSSVREGDNSIYEFVKKEIDNGKYIVFLQPKCNFNNILIEAEALIRYKDEEKIIGPDDFIPLFEKMKIISYIDLFVFEVICKKLNEWRKNDFRIFPISFNFSRETLMSNGLVIRMETIRKLYDIPSNLLVIEITESAKTQDFISERKVINELKEKGYHFSMDDFGVDYSNLKSFIEYPFSSIKIDKGLVDVIETNWKGRILMENVISVCHEIGSKVIVEGVENINQFRFFKEKKCDMVQGYYIDRPLSFEVFEKKYLNIAEGGNNYEMVP